MGDADGTTEGVVVWVSVSGNGVNVLVIVAVGGTGVAVLVDVKVGVYVNVGVNVIG